MSSGPLLQIYSHFIHYYQFSSLDDTVEYVNIHRLSKLLPSVLTIGSYWVQWVKKFLWLLLSSLWVRLRKPQSFLSQIIVGETKRKATHLRLLLGDYHQSWTSKTKVTPVHCHPLIENITTFVSYTTILEKYSHTLQVIERKCVEKKTNTNDAYIYPN